MRLKKILQNINILNIILIAAVIAFAAYSIFPTLEMKVKYALPAAKNIEGTADKKTGELEIPSLTQYTAVVDDNLFHPERRIPPEKKVEQPLPQPDFVLYGTMLSDNLSLAYLEDLKAPRNTPGRGKRQVALKKGDSMSGFILKEIETDKILMVRGEEKLIVAMNDPQKPKSRAVAAVTNAATAPAPTPAQKQRESRRAASDNQTPKSTPPPLTRALEAGPEILQSSQPTVNPAPSSTSPSPSGTTGHSSGGLADYYRKLRK
jgi:hypothetical protein